MALSSLCPTEALFYPQIQSKGQVFLRNRAFFLSSCTLQRRRANVWLGAKRKEQEHLPCLHGRSTRAAYSGERNAPRVPFPPRLPRSHPLTPRAGNHAKMKEVPTFAALRQFRVAEQVRCHNSGKIIVIGSPSQQLAWYGGTAQGRGQPSSTQTELRAKGRRLLLSHESPPRREAICGRDHAHPHLTEPPLPLFLTQRRGRGKYWKTSGSDDNGEHLRNILISFVSTQKETLWQFARLYVPTARCRSQDSNSRDPSAMEPPNARGGGIFSFH